MGGFIICCSSQLAHLVVSCLFCLVEWVCFFWVDSRYYGLLVDYFDVLMLTFGFVDCYLLIVLTV